MKKLIIVAVLLVVAACVFVWVLSGPKTVGKDVKEASFKEFYYTYSTTNNPPEFQRYRIFAQGGKKMFYHEKREGSTVFLTEEDITVAGQMELSSAEWDALWSCLSGGTVTNRKESANAGGGGPWLYLYWTGDNDKCQEFAFASPDAKATFEELCAELKAKALAAGA